jgi:hypothetical protein
MKKMISLLCLLGLLGVGSCLDSDQDGQADPIDSCPYDALNDVDQDGICADRDNCPNSANPDQKDSNDDGIGDTCQPQEDLVTLSYDNGKSALYYTIKEPVYEYVRFAVDKPTKIWHIEVYWANVTKPAPPTLYLWPDFGGNGFNFDVDHPLAVLQKEIAPSDATGWIHYILPEPLTIDPPGYFYVGHYSEAGNGPMFAMDDATQDSTNPPCLLWYPKRPNDQYGFPYIRMAQGYFLVRVGITYFDLVDTFWFRDVTTAAGLNPGGRVAWGDYDNDGDDDLMISGLVLYRNNGDGSFSNVNDAAKITGIGASGGVWGDYDQDGFLDFFAIGLADYLLHNNGDGTFSDVTSNSGISDEYEVTCEETKVQHLPTEGAGWADYDNDGYLDLYLANYECGSLGAKTPDLLFHNNGDGTFTDVTVSSGIWEQQMPWRAGRGVNWGDYDNDGDQDIFVSNYRLDPNFLWRNNGDGTFTEVAQSSGVQGTPHKSGANTYYGHTIGSVWGDFNADGYLDLFSANLAHPRFIDIADQSALFLNDGPPSFTFRNVTDQTGLIYRETYSNPTLWDFDNDSDLDLFITCVYEGQPSSLYRHDENLALTQVNYPSGLIIDNGWGSAVTDYDLDGDLDLVANRLFENDLTPRRNWLQVRPVGIQSNTAAIGARVYVTPAGASQPIMREVNGGSGTTSQDSLVQHIGLGSATSATVQVRFPSGLEIVQKNVVVNQRIWIYEDGRVSYGFRP